MTTTPRRAVQVEQLPAAHAADPRGAGPTAHPPGGDEGPPGGPNTPALTRGSLPSTPVAAGSGPDRHRPLPADDVHGAGSGRSARQAPGGTKGSPGACRPAVVIGVDLSLTSTGVAGHDWVQRITSSGRKTATLTERWVRLRQLANHVEDLTAAADLVVIEQPAYSRSMGSMHDRSGLWWLVVDRLRFRGVPVAEVTPTARARYATGRGNAGKDEVLAAVVRRYPDVPILGNDEADAYVLAAMGLDHLGQPPATVPQTHRAALDKVAWPEAVSRP